MLTPSRCLEHSLIYSRLVFPSVVGSVNAFVLAPVLRQGEEHVFTLCGEEVLKLQHNYQVLASKKLQYRAASRNSTRESWLLLFLER